MFCNLFQIWDSKRWDGILLPFNVQNIEQIVIEVLKQQRRYKEITIAQVILNDGQKFYAVNDFFIGQKTHASARYTINYNNIKEQQFSSGIIVSTGLGSTGWFKSILAGASGVASYCLSQRTNLKQREKFFWNSDFL